MERQGCLPIPKKLDKYLTNREHGRLGVDDGIFQTTYEQYWLASEHGIEVAWKVVDYLDEKFPRSVPDQMHYLDIAHHQIALNVSDNDKEAERKLGTILTTKDILKYRFQYEHNGELYENFVREYEQLDRNYQDLRTGIKRIVPKWIVQGAYDQNKVDELKSSGWKKIRQQFGKTIESAPGDLQGFKFLDFDYHPFTPKEGLWAVRSSAGEKIFYGKSNRLGTKLEVEREATDAEKFDNAMNAIHALVEIKSGLHPHTIRAIMDKCEKLQMKEHLGKERK